MYMHNIVDKECQYAKVQPRYVFSPFACMPLELINLYSDLLHMFVTYPGYYSTNCFVNVRNSHNICSKILSLFFFAYVSDFFLFQPHLIRVEDFHREKLELESMKYWCQNMNKLIQLISLISILYYSYQRCELIMSHRNTQSISI